MVLQPALGKAPETLAEVDAQVVLQELFASNSMIARGAKSEPGIARALEYTILAALSNMDTYPWGYILDDPEILINDEVRAGMHADALGEEDDGSLAPIEAMAFPAKAGEDGVYPYMIDWAVAAAAQLVEYVTPIMEARPENKLEADEAAALKAEGTSLDDEGVRRVVRRRLSQMD